MTVIVRNATLKYLVTIRSNMLGGAKGIVWPCDLWNGHVRQHASLQAPGGWQR